MGRLMSWLRKHFDKLKKVTSDDVPKTKTPAPKQKPKPIKKRTGRVVKDHTKFEDE